MKCITRGRRTPQPHQRRFVQAFIDSDEHGSLAIHAVGTGKTLLSVLCCKCFADKYPDSKIIVVTPASLLSGFKSELCKYELSRNRQYRYHTYASFAQRGDLTECHNALLIIDESQNLKDPEGAMFKAVLECSKRARKVLLLSATPMVNSPADIIAQMALVNGDDPISSTMFDAIVRRPKLTKAYFGCQLSFYDADPVASAKFFPKVKERYVFFPMDDRTHSTYLSLERDKSTVRIANLFEIDDPNDSPDLQSFFNGLRRVSSSSAQKIDFMMEFIGSVHRGRPNTRLGLTKQILDSHTDKFIIFTHFKDHGSSRIVARLRKDRIPFGVVDGSVPKHIRAKIVDSYVAGQIKVILISQAGATGLNLLETGYMFLVDPSWNQSEVTQVVARARRYLSHDKLPRSKRNVYVMKLMLIKPEEAKVADRLVKDKLKYEKHVYRGQPVTPSIDIKMVVDSVRKQKHIDKMLDMLESKVPSLEMCDRRPSSIPMSLGELRVMHRLDPVPRSTWAMVKLMSANNVGFVSPTQGKLLASGRVSKGATLNKPLLRNLISMATLSSMRYKTAIFIDAPSPTIASAVLKFSELAHVHCLRECSGEPRSFQIRAIPRRPIYKVGIYNGYMNLATGIPIATKPAAILERASAIIQASRISIIMLGWDVFRSSSGRHWFATHSKNKSTAKIQVQQVGYLSDFFKFETGAVRDPEMVVLRFTK